MGVVKQIDIKNRAYYFYNDNWSQKLSCKVVKN